MYKFVRACMHCSIILTGFTLKLQFALLDDLTSWHSVNILSIHLKLSSRAICFVENEVKTIT